MLPTPTLLASGSSGRDGTHRSLALLIAIGIAQSACVTHGAFRGGDSRASGTGREAHVTMDRPLWRVSDLAGAEGQVLLLRGRNGLHGAVAIADVATLDGAAARLFAALDLPRPPAVTVIGASGINAYAFMNHGEPMIAVTPGMIRLVARDRDAWAALIGHELAHLELDHLRDQANRRRQGETVSSLAGAVLATVGVPLASVASDAASVLADRAFSREDELAADRRSLDYLRRAGFDPNGAIRLQRLLMSVEGETIPFLSTHPGGEDRIAKLRRLLEGAE